jgi:hypothetical protein
VDKLESTEEAAERLKTILRTMSGDLTIAEACERLGVSESRFHQMRDRALAGAAGSLESRPPGRPRKEASREESELESLRREVRELREELVYSRARAVLATAFPHLVKDPNAREEKKTAPKKDPRREKRRRRKAERKSRKRD